MAEGARASWQCRKCQRRGGCCSRRRNFHLPWHDRPPEAVFAEGLQPRGANQDLFRYALGNEPSILVATSKSPTIAREFAEMQGGGYVYTIRRQANGVDVNAVLGARNPFPSELEIAVPGGIKPSERPDEGAGGSHRDFQSRVGAGASRR